jgi:predicted dehydrogenase
VDKSLKVGVIGVGGIARVHMPGWEASPHAEVIAGSDISTEALEVWGRTNGISRLTVNPDDLLSDPDIDIIDVCTPNMYHTELVVAALNAGKHVICEKPLAPTPQEIGQMIEARDRADRLLMTAQHFRFKGTSQAMKRELDTGIMGTIYHARSWMLRRGWLPARPGFVYRRNSGGGPCIDIGVHILDLTLWFMGNPTPVAVSGIAKAPLAHLPDAFSSWGRAPVPQDMDVEDFAAAFVRFDTGATLIIEVSWLLHHDTKGEDMQMWLYGTGAGCHWPGCMFMETKHDTQQFTNRTLQLIEDTMEPHALECCEFARCVAEGLPSPVSAEQSLQVMTILDGIYRSQAEGREVRLEAVSASQDG